MLWNKLVKGLLLLPSFRPSPLQLFELRSQGMARVNRGLAFACRQMKDEVISIRYDYDCLTMAAVTSVFGL